MQARPWTWRRLKKRFEISKIVCAKNPLNDDDDVLGLGKLGILNVQTSDSR
ncbi:MAG: hypothetical protein JSS83_29085 [Cyanobacteria bacterium SZAS LIN-3]|nr:hypothetical protein [Cyanobacteria bacterium SZAS LIN-3]